MFQGVAGKVGERHEEAPFDEEDSGRGEGEDAVAEDQEIRQQVFQVGGFGRQAGADEEVGEAKEDEVQQADDAGGPGEADAWEEGLQDQREDDSAHTPAGSGEAGGLAAFAQEEVPDGGDGRGEDQGGAEPADDAEDQEEMPVAGADAQQELRGHEQHAAGEDEVARPAGVEDGPDLDAGEEGEEGIDAEDPAEGAFGDAGELVRDEVGMVGADCVHHPEGDHQAAEGAEDAQPGAQTTFRVGVAVGIGGHASGGGGEVGSLVLVTGCWSGGERVG